MSATAVASALSRWNACANMKWTAKAMILNRTSELSQFHLSVESRRRHPSGSHSSTENSCASLACCKNCPGTWAQPSRQKVCIKVAVARREKRSNGVVVGRSSHHQSLSVTTMNKKKQRMRSPGKRLCFMHFTSANGLSQRILTLGARSG
jgi:hypothetical protein